MQCSDIYVTGAEGLNPITQGFGTFPYHVPYMLWNLPILLQIDPGLHMSHKAIGCLLLISMVRLAPSRSKIRYFLFQYLARNKRRQNKLPEMDTGHLEVKVPTHVIRD